LYCIQYKLLENVILVILLTGKSLPNFISEESYVNMGFLISRPMSFSTLLQCLYNQLLSFTFASAKNSLSFRLLILYLYLYIPRMLQVNYALSHNCRYKVKCTLVQALRLCTGRTAHRGSRRIALLFHDHGTRRG